jgi:hypothetical protein
VNRKNGARAAPGELDRLAVVERFEFRELLDVALHQIGEFVLGERCRAMDAKHRIARELTMSLERSKPDTPFHGAVVSALRAAATARSMSLGDAGRDRAVGKRSAHHGTSTDVPATTSQIRSSFAGFMHLPSARSNQSTARGEQARQRTHAIVSWLSTDGTNLLSMNKPVLSLMVLPVAAILISVVVIVVDCRGSAET